MFRKNKTPEISFYCDEIYLDVYPHPVEASKAMPEWFKRLYRDIDGKDKTDAGTAKRCIPILDAVSQGFIIPLWTDVHVKVSNIYRLLDENDNLIAEWRTCSDPETEIGKTLNGSVIHSYEKTGKHIWVKIPDPSTETKAGIGQHGWEQVGDLCDLKKFELGKVLLKFNNPWTIRTPKGWSVQFKNPANNWSNNIQLIEGVVDCDEYVAPVNFPFVWTGSEVGEWIISKGTPLVHVIPFRREKISKTVVAKKKDLEDRVNAKLTSLFSDRYRRLFWHKRNKT